MDSANPGKLKAFAVLAFCAEMTLLPGHCEPRSSPVKATAHDAVAIDDRSPHVEIETAVGLLARRG